MSEQQITVEHLYSLASDMRGSKARRDFIIALNQFAAQQRADATQQLQRVNAELKARTQCALPAITDEIFDLLGESDLITWDREKNRPHWTQTAVDAASCFVAQCLCRDRNNLRAELAAAKQQHKSDIVTLQEANGDLIKELGEAKQRLEAAYRDNNDGLNNMMQQLSAELARVSKKMERRAGLNVPMIVAYTTLAALAVVFGNVSGIDPLEAIAAQENCDAN